MEILRWRENYQILIPPWHQSLGDNFPKTFAPGETSLRPHAGENSRVDSISCPMGSYVEYLPFMPGKNAKQGSGVSNSILGPGINFSQGKFIRAITPPDPSGMIKTTLNWTPPACCISSLSSRLTNTSRRRILKRVYGKEIQIVTTRILEWKVAALLFSFVQITDYSLFFSIHDTLGSLWSAFKFYLKGWFSELSSYWNSPGFTSRLDFTPRPSQPDSNLDQNGKKRWNFSLRMDQISYGVHRCRRRISSQLVYSQHPYMETVLKEFSWVIFNTPAPHRTPPQFLRME